MQEVTADKKLNEEVDTFALSAQLTVKAILADKNEILKMAKNKIKEDQGLKGEFLNIDPSSLKYEVLTIDADKQEATVKIEISGLTSLDPDKNIFDKNLLVGFTKEDLELYFSQFESVKSIHVEFSPFWVKKVPILKDHIIIQIAK